MPNQNFISPRGTYLLHVDTDRLYFETQKDGNRNTWAVEALRIDAHGKVVCYIGCRYQDGLKHQIVTEPALISWVGELP